MLAIATIVFREILEIALVLGIIMAATRGMKGRLSIAMAGLGMGAFGAMLLAFFTDVISNAMEGVGQEIFNACIMFTAVAFLSWTVVWMRKHARELTQHLQQVGKDVLLGKRSHYALVTIIAFSTLREGSEIVLFSYGMLASGHFHMLYIILGAIVGLLGGVSAGLLLYVGLLRAAKRHLFSVTSWMLILLSAGMAAQGAGFLVAADVLPALVPEVWDTSAIISGQSLVGQTLGVLVGYTPRPSGMELLFYVSVMLSVSLLYVMSGMSFRKASA